ncbi:hypothetical protein W97_08187 [Coniosporium apollinis CBS 100218]|uniref:Uncharacterized protein n=1 Tax=Coniosporium apollinis (strain CBS 100218) TaxID=1168221 RepID=R7Z4I5_CONA1|nr:uncharacterized protein W97_08187 [Coniosporium apollinis CBS 100218]EON68929.1 hypothetical protein W97_08187 [Coniosporium apollinis CBS 100218]
MYPQSQKPRNVIVPLCKLLVAYFLFCVVEFQFWPSLSENLPYPVFIGFVAETCVGLVWHVVVKRISAAVVLGWSSGTVVYSSEAQPGRRAPWHRFFEVANDLIMVPIYAMAANYGDRLSEDTSLPGWLCVHACLILASLVKYLCIALYTRVRRLI